MAAGWHNITIEGGATFSSHLRWMDADGALIDTSLYTARMQVRRLITDTDVLYSMTNVSGITLGIVGSGDDAYNIAIDITATDTTALASGNRPVKAYYDLELVTGGVVTRLLEGNVFIKAEVTR